MSENFEEHSLLKQLTTDNTHKPTQINSHSSSPNGVYIYPSLKCTIESNVMENNNFPTHSKYGHIRKLSATCNFISKTSEVLF